MSNHKIYGFCDTGCKREVVSKELYLDTVSNFNMKEHRVNQYISGTSPIYFDLNNVINGWVNILGCIIEYDADGAFKKVNYVSFNGYVSKNVTGNITLESNEHTIYKTHTGKVRLYISFQSDKVGLLANLQGDNGTAYYFSTNEFYVNSVYYVVPQTNVITEALGGSY